MHIPTVNIGIRQKGRMASKSVLNCGNSAEEISAAIRFALSPEGQESARTAENPYFQPDTLGKITSAILNADFSKLKTKKFFDIPHSDIL